MRKNRIALLIGICLLAAGPVNGCAQKNNNTVLESDSETESESQEISVESEKHYWVNWQGEIFDGTSAPGGVDESLETFVWMAFRSGTVVAENQSAEEDLYVTESGQVLGGNEETSDTIWIRIEQESFIPDEGSLGQISHKDYIFYRQGEDAYVGVQSGEDTELWTILNMADYGDWLEKEIGIYIKMTTGLDVSYVDSMDTSNDEQIPTPQKDFVPIANLFTGSNTGASIEDLVVMYVKIPIKEYMGVYEKISSAESAVLSENIGRNVSDETDWYYVSGHTDMQYLIRSGNQEYSLWKFMCFECDEYPYKDVLELVYQIDSVDMISEIEVSPPRMDNTDGGKAIQDRIGTHEITDRGDIDTIYRILSSLTCYGSDHWDMIDYGAADAPVDAEPSHRAVLLGRYLSIITDYGNEIDGLKYTAVSNMFYEFSGIAYNRLSEEQAESVYEILGITGSVEELQNG